MTDDPKARLDRATLLAVPHGVWAIGVVSLLMDMSSEMIHALLPVYLVTAMGASMLTVGIVDGIAEATASIVKVFSGALSDWFGKRKALAVLGYGLAAATKPIFPLAGSVAWVLVARFLDRIGKGIRGAPRDALLADITPKRLYGASYGLRQALDTAGAVLGPLLAMVLMWLLAGQFTSVFWFAVIPAVLSVAFLVAMVREPAGGGDNRPARFPLRLRELRRLGPAYWALVAAAAAFSLARFSEAFLILRAQSLGLDVVLVPLVLVIMNIAYTLAAYPAGVLSDELGRLRVLGLGIVLLVLADLILAFAPGFLWVAVGVAVWGVHMGFTQGLLSALVADTAPANLRGTAFGAFNMIVGLALLAASILTGGVWDALGARAAFLLGAAIAAVSLLSFVLIGVSNGSAVKEPR